MRIFIVLLVALTLGSCTQPAPKTDNIYGVWRHSVEEDTENAEIYRRPAYDFPPAQARQSFLLDKDGSFTLLPIEPNDAIGEIKGNWTEVNKGEVKVNLNDETKTTFVIKTDQLSSGKISKLRDKN